MIKFRVAEYLKDQMPGQNSANARRFAKKSSQLMENPAIGMNLANA